jgi:CRP-like cAMP-binding protein
MYTREILSKVSYFDNLEGLDNLIITKNIKAKKYENHNTIRDVNENCEWVDIVVSGQVIAYYLSENGDTTTMFEFVKGSIIGANLILIGGFYPLNFYAKGVTQIISISKTGIEELLHNYDFSIKFFRALSINSQNLNKKVFLLHKKTIRDNLIDYFKKQVVLQNSSTFVLPISKKELADYLGVQRQSLFRELKKMQDDNIIETYNRKVTFFD